MTNKVIIALDYEKEADALALVDQLDPQTCRLKVGKEMFTTLGTGFVKQLHSRHFDVFLNSMTFQIQWQERFVLPLI